MKKFILFPLLACGAASPELAHAQSGYASYCNATSVAPTYNTGTFAPLTCNTNGQLEITGSLAATAAGSLPTLTSGASSPLYLDLSGRLYTETYLAPGTNPIGTVNVTAATTGGATPNHVLSASGLNATSIKSSAGTLYSVTALNTTTTTGYLKFYNTSSAPSCTGTSVQMTFPLVQNVPITVSPAVGVAFSSGIGICITGGQSDTDGTSAIPGITVSVAYQ